VKSSAKAYIVGEVLRVNQIVSGGGTALRGRVLLLNGSSWEPLAVITVPRAINLILAGKAVVIEQSGHFLKTIRDQFPVPSVIALRTYINVPRRQAHWSRKGVLVRDNYTCIYCGVQAGSMVKGKVISRSDFTVDHILPKSRGGKDTWTNTACACYHCNHRKGDKYTYEIGMKMRWEPKTPRTSYLVIAIGTGPDAWKRYVELNIDP
jgi:5-methylcytosine-specific restriction endonuclease McrA